MRKVTLGAMAAMFAVPAIAASPLPPQIAATVGNTLHYQTADGKFEMWITSDADGSYRATVTPPGAPPMTMSGRWAVVGSDLCRTQTTPPPPPGRARICEPFATYPLEGRPGSLMGGKMNITLMKGTVGPGK